MRRVERESKLTLQATPSLPTSFPLGLLHYRFEALDLEREVAELVVESPSTSSNRRRQLIPCLKTASDKKERRVIIVGSSLLRGTEGPVCGADPHQLWFYDF